jgi:hypothetical protein
MHRDRLPLPGPLPWKRPRHELLLLALIAAATLFLVLPENPQDVSRLCLTRALVHGKVWDNVCLNNAVDTAFRDGHLYSDKAPGFSVLAIPAALAVRLPPKYLWTTPGAEKQIWAVRLLTSGVALLLCAFLLGRVAEGLVPGWGGASLVTFALGTVVSSFGVASFDHVPAAAIGFGAFVLAWSRRPLLAGLLAGAAVLVEYEAGLIALAVGAYVLLLGRRAAGRYLLGLIPGVALIGAYDWAAFGSPLHLSYQYVTDPAFSEHQSGGLFGIHLPTLHGTYLVFAGNRGLLYDSPVLAAAAFGLVLLWRRGWRAEALVCAFVACAFIVLNAGYFLPYGGDSPGPRFLVPMLPFLAVGLAPAFAWRPLVTGALALLSVIASTAIMLTWPGAAGSGYGYRWNVWRELAVLVHSGPDAPLARWAQKTVLTWAGVGRLGSEAIVALLAAAALAIAYWVGWSARGQDALRP